MGVQVTANYESEFLSVTSGVIDNANETAALDNEQASSLDEGGTQAAAAQATGDSYWAAQISTEEAGKNNTNTISSYEQNETDLNTQFQNMESIASSSASTASAAGTGALSLGDELATEGITVIQYLNSLSFS